MLDGELFPGNLTQCAQFVPETFYLAQRDGSSHRNYISRIVLHLSDQLSRCFQLFISDVVEILIKHRCLTFQCSYHDRRDERAESVGVLAVQLINRNVQKLHLVSLSVSPPELPSPLSQTYFKWHRDSNGAIVQSLLPSSVAVKVDFANSRRCAALDATAAAAGVQ